jgi:hypothetical protein
MTASQIHHLNSNNWNAAKVVAAALGVLVGVAAIEHGFFEILQGNVRPDGVMIDAIGPAQKFWEYGGETALTLIPNFLVSGILSVIFGVGMVIWAWRFVGGKYGAWILLLFTIILFLVGGGFAPVFVGLLASLTASRINKPITWLPKILPGFILNFLANIWLGILVTAVAMFVVSVEIAIFGWPLTAFFEPDVAIELLTTASLVMFGMMVLSAVAGLACDSQKMALTATGTLVMK